MGWFDNWLRNREIDQVIAKGFDPTPAELWIGPNVGSDFRRLFTEPDRWTDARARIHGFMLGGLNVLIDKDHPDRARSRVGENYWENIVASGMFPLLHEWRLPLALEMYGGDNGLESIRLAKERVDSAGGHIAAISLDQAGTQTTPDFIAEAKALTGATIGVIEGYPSIPAVDIQTRTQVLIDAGQPPAWLHIDLDVYGVRDQGISEETFGQQMRKLHAFCQERGIVFGLLATAGRTKSSAQFAHDTQRFIARLRGHLGRNPDRWIVQSFWYDDDDTSPKSRPHNAPDSDPHSLTGIALSLVNA